MFSAEKDYNPLESRKEWMLNIFGYAGRNNKNNTEFQFWKQDYHPIELNTPEKLQQRLAYLHKNPVRGGIVWEDWHYKYSSAVDYGTVQPGLLSIELLACCIKRNWYYRNQFGKSVTQEQFEKIKQLGGKQSIYTKSS